MGVKVPRWRSGRHRFSVGRVLETRPRGGSPPHGARHPPPHRAPWAGGSPPAHATTSLPFAVRRARSGRARCHPRGDRVSPLMGDVSRDVSRRLRALRNDHRDGPALQRGRTPSCHTCWPSR